jgi:hypothetical protein
MDSAFDRVASGRTIKCLVVVNDATHESVAIVPEHTSGGDHLTRKLDGNFTRSVEPAVIRTAAILIVGMALVPVRVVDETSNPAH